MTINETRSYIEGLEKYLDFQNDTEFKGDNFVHYYPEKAIKIKNEIRLFKGILRQRGQEDSPILIESRMDDINYLSELGNEGEY